MTAYRERALTVAALLLHADLLPALWPADA